MALPNSRQQREYNKFVQRADGQTAVAVDIESADQGGGGVGGGNTIYSNSSGDFTATANAATKTITISGFATTEDNVVPGLILSYDSSGNVTKLPLTSVAVAANVITLDDMTSAFAAGDSVVVFLVGAPREHDTSTDSKRTFEINPLSEHHVEETLVDEENGTDGTYYYYVDMDGYKHFSAQMELNGGSGTVTATVEATNQDDGTAAASCTYQDVTNALFGAASFTASNFLIADTALSFKYVRYKIVASTGGANDADWTIYHKKQY